MPTLLFIHGFATTPSIWEQQTSEFSKDYKVSTNPNGNVLSENDVFIIGWSMGGLKAIELALQFRKKVKGLVLVSAFTKFLKSSDYPYGLPPALFRNLERKLKSNLDDGLAFFYKLIANNTHPTSIPASGSFTQQQILKDLERLKTIDIRPLLPQITIPTLILHGGCDQIVPVESGKFLHDNIKGSEFHVFQGVGHAPFIERPEQFNQLIKQWINKK